MDLASLKRDFGRDLTFWGGGTDTEHFLPRASVGEIRDQVKMIFDIMAPGGGFVFVPPITSKLTSPLSGWMLFTRPRWKHGNTVKRMVSSNRGGQFRLRHVLRYGSFIIFGALILFFGLSSKSFFSSSNALLILQQAAPLGIVAIGMTFVLVVAGIDTPHWSGHVSGRSVGRHRH